MRELERERVPLTGWAGHAERIAPVLCYHSIDARPSAAMAPYATTPAALAAHVSLLSDRGFELVTLSRLAEELRAGLPRPVAAITFDDALTSFANAALPVLRALAVPSTVYVPTGWVGARAGWMGAPEPIMTWSQLRELDADGVELGAHGHHHRELDVGPGPAEEIETCKRILEDGLQHPVRSFAYPFGAHDRRVRDAVAAAGFDNAVAVKHAWSHRGTDPYSIARILVGPGHDARWLASRLDRRRPLDPVHERARTRLRRRWRRHRARRTRVRS